MGASEWGSCRPPTLIGNGPTAGPAKVRGIREHEAIRRKETHLALTGNVFCERALCPQFL